MSDHLHILIVGASGRFAAASAVAAGHAVSVVDLFGDLDTQRICKQSGRFLSVIGEQVSAKTFKIESLKTLTRSSRDLFSENEKRFLEIQALGADAVIFTGGAENYPEFFGSQFLSMASTVGPSADSIEELLNVKSIERACVDHGIRRPCTIYALDQMVHVEVEGSAKTLLQKKIRSGGGLQTHRWDGVTSVDFSAGEYLQEFIEGDTVSGCYISSKRADQTEALLLGSCVQHPSFRGADFRYRGSLGPIYLADHDRLEIARVGKCIAEAFQLAGVFGIDFVRTNEGLHLVDINPRIPASAELIERSRRMHEPAFSIVGAHLDACLRNLLPTSIELSAQRPYSKTVIYLPADRRLKVDAGLIDYFLSESYITDLPVLGSEVEPSHPLVTIHAEASDLESLSVKAEQRIGELWKQMEEKLTIV